MNTMLCGKNGEERAAALLINKGYTVLSRNFSTNGGEIDIIAQYKKMLVFIEVKTRSYQVYGGPMAAVTRSKQQKIVNTALEYIKARRPKFDSIRFDVVCVLPEEITHIENAFIPPRTIL